MKTTLLAICFFSISLITKAQFTEPGQKVLGGSITFNNGNNNENNNPGSEFKGTSFMINASMGKFTKKNILSSFTLSFLSSNSKQITPTNISANPIIAFSAFYGETYYKQIAKRFYFGISGNIGFNYETLKVTQTISTIVTKSDAYAIGLNIYPILSYQLTNRFVLNLSPSTSFFNLNYNYEKSKFTSANQVTTTGESKSFNLNTGFFASPLSNLSFGFSYLLKRK